MTRVALHTEVFNDDGSLAGHITITSDDSGYYAVRSVIPEEDLDVTQPMPYESYAAARYVLMVNKVKNIAQRNKVKDGH